MSFAAPWTLLGLITVAALIAAYASMLNKQRPQAVVHSDLGLLRAALPQVPRWRRHLPFALVVVSLVALIGATARPEITTTKPISRTTIVLALDVSRSMCATDIEPNRLAVAQQAAGSFIEAQPEAAQIGIVTFSAAVDIAVPPTSDKVALTSAVGGLTTGFGTAMGSATLKAIDVIAAINPDVPPIGSDAVPTGPGSSVPDLPDIPDIPDIVVILTDGASSQGKDPLVAADEAAARGIRIFTIGFGTDQPTEMVCSVGQTGVTLFADPRFDPSGGGGFVDPVAGLSGGNVRQLLVIDEPTLKTVANITGGEYFRAQDAAQLQQVFASLPAQLEQEAERSEITVAFVIAGALAAIAAFGFAVLWR